LWISTGITQQLDAVAKVQTEVGHRVPASAALAGSTDPGGAPPVMGVQFIALDKPKLAQFHIGSDHGAMLITVAAASPAATAGLRVGDVVIRFDGTPIATNADLQNAVARVPPHGKVPVEFWRGGQEKASSASIQF
jgi:S1-C subfamily serine protease